MNDQPPSGLPDENVLTRLANEFFAAGYGEMPKTDPALNDQAALLHNVVPRDDTVLRDIATSSIIHRGGPERDQADAARFAVPTASAPGISAPGISVPGISAPGISAPGISAPGISVPDLAPDSFADSVSLLPPPPASPDACSTAPSGEPTMVEVMSATNIVTPEFYFVVPNNVPTAASSTITPEGRSLFDVNSVRRDFPILSQRVYGHRLVWMDNAATTQKPQEVIDRLTHFYTYENSNIHRGAHELAARATDAFESARDTVARFLGAGSSAEIVFVRGTTEAINLVAQSWGRKNVGAGDEIVIAHLEHHANIVPWQQLVAEKDATLRVIPVDDSGQVLLDEYGKLLNRRTRLVAVSHVSNALGTVTPVRQIIEMAHSVGALALIDGAQAVAHVPVNVAELNPDFYVFSGHKIFAPNGIGVLYGKSAVLEEMPPWQGGGNMITHVTVDRSEFQHPPARFEAGTGSIADAVGLGTALDYVQRIGLPHIARYEHELLDYATTALRTVPGLRLIGTAADKASVLSFVLAGYRPDEVGAALNREGIAVRAGHHCAQPILRHYGLEATVRPSLAFYNTFEEVDLLVATLRRLAAYAGH